MNEIACRSIRDVVDFAVKREEEARDFYADCRDKTPKDGLKSFFQELADEEERHRGLLLDLDLSDDQEFEPEQVQNLKLSDYLVDAQFTPDISYQDALTLAMKKEQKAHAFYDAWQKRCSNSSAGKLFAFLAGEEMKHKRKLEDIYDDDILMWN